MNRRNGSDDEAASETKGLLDTEPDTKPVLLPGTSLKAYAMLPLRAILTGSILGITYPLLLFGACARAIYLRLTKGTPSQILKYGTYPTTDGVLNHGPDMPYPAHHLFKEPLDEDKLRAACVNLCADAGITADKVEVKFIDEAPNDWPETGSWDQDYFIPSMKAAGENHLTYWEAKSRAKSGKIIRFHIYNATQAGKPTVMLHHGSGLGFDGSSNFNFVKELVNRYMGNPPNKVFQTPEISPESAKKLDQGSFAMFLLKMPYNLGINLGGLVWNLVRAAKWAGGNGIGYQLVAMNFTKEESLKLYLGAKALGVKPFACFTYASVKAAKEVLKEDVYAITQQASIQTRHYPIPDQKSRDLVGDWLLGPLCYPGPAEKFDLKAAQKAYVDLRKEIEEIGPRLTSSFWAKAYGIVNSGAATFEALPTYNDDMMLLNRCLFMNNYGVRTMPENSPFHTWNWNAPIWLGVNTINVDGCTTTMVGSMIFGSEVVAAVRDNIEATLREIMEKAPADMSGAAVPTATK